MMRSRFARALTVLLIVGVGVGIVSGALLAGARSFEDPAPIPAALSSADPDAIASHTYLIDCDHQPVTRPASFVLTCADANSSIEPAQWSVWGGPTALGSGSYLENDCTPDCAAGTFHSYPVRLVADELARADGTAHYRRIRLRFAGSAPSWVKRHIASFDVDFFAQP